MAFVQTSSSRCWALTSSGRSWRRHGLMGQLSASTFCGLDASSKKALIGHTARMLDSFYKPSHTCAAICHMQTAGENVAAGKD